jgi:hypothetical protein
MDYGWGYPTAGTCGRAAYLRFADFQWLETALVTDVIPFCNFGALALAKPL